MKSIASTGLSVVIVILMFRLSLVLAGPDEVLFHKQFSDGQTIAPDTVFCKQLMDGRLFEVKAFQVCTDETNDKALIQRYKENGLDLKNCRITAVAYVMSSSNSVLMPCWTNHVSWPSPVPGISHGIDFFDAETIEGGVFICYKNLVDIYVENIIPSKLGIGGDVPVRQIICTDSSEAGLCITNVSFVVSNSLPARIVASGSLPVEEISWKRDDEKWILDTNKLKAGEIENLQILFRRINK